MSVLLDYLRARKIAPETLVRAGLSESRSRELFENHEPTIEEIRAISRTLRVPARDLIIPLRRASSDQTRFRSNFNYSSNEFSLLEALRVDSRFLEISDSIEIQSELPFFLEFPKDANSAEHLSRIFRTDLLDRDLISPLVDLPTIIFNKFRVITFLFSSRNIDGACFRGDKSAIIGIAERNDIRMIYTLAHEICHLLTDVDDADPNGTWFDEDVLKPNRKDVRTDELFANEFAAALLIPVEGLRRQIAIANALIEPKPPSLTAFHIAHIARRFGTSFYVAGRRCESLGLLNTGATAALQNALNRQYGSAEKYADEVGIAARDPIDWLFPVKSVVNLNYERIIRGDISLSYLSNIMNLRLS